MSYCAYEALIGKEVVVHHPNHKNLIAVIGTLDGVGETAIGIKNWRPFNRDSMVMGPVCEEVLVINKSHGFRRIILASDELAHLEALRASRIQSLRRELDRLEQRHHGFTESS